MAHLLFFLLISSGLAGALAPSPQVADEHEDRFQTLISQLDATRFSIREQATQSLIALGPTALEPLARHVLIASPEALRRIKTCLEEIGTASDEETFYRAIGILTAVYGGGNEVTDAQIAKFQREWSRRRTLKAIDYLREKGATVVGSAGGNQNIQEQLLLDGFPFEDPAENTAPFREPPVHVIPDPEQLQQQIENILANSLEENRELVLASSQRLREQETQPISPSSRLEQRILILGNGQVNRLRFGNRIASRTGVQVELGTEWQGSSSDLARLNEIENLTHLTLHRQKLDRKLLERVQSLTDLVQLAVRQCDLSSPAMATVGLPPDLESLRFIQQEISVSLIDRIEQRPQIARLAFDHCDFSKAALSGLFRLEQLAELELRGMPLDDRRFERIANLSELQLLQLSECRFQLEDYYAFQRSRSDVTVELIPVAFMGVRSDLAAQRLEERLGCLISEVVPQSGAARGGIQVGDRIDSLNGVPIRKFEDLRALVSQYPAGQPLEIRVERQGAMKSLSVELGPYDEAPTY